MHPLHVIPEYDIIMVAVRCSVDNRRRPQGENDERSPLYQNGGLAELWWQTLSLTPSSVNWGFCSPLTIQWNLEGWRAGVGLAPVQQHSVQVGTQSSVQEFSWVVVKFSCCFSENTKLQPHAVVPGPHRLVTRYTNLVRCDEMDCFLLKSSNQTEFFESLHLQVQSTQMRC